MELLKGDDLAAIVEQRRAIPPVEVVGLLHQAALALDRTHAAGVVHRDLKPENLFVTTRDDGSPRLKVLDFGIAKVTAQGASAKTTRSLGTPLYMAPEQIMAKKDIGPAADLYAMGHIAYTLLAGEAYWAREATAHDGIFPFFQEVMQGARQRPTDRARERGERAKLEDFRFQVETAHKQHTTTVCFKRGDRWFPDQVLDEGECADAR